MERKTLVNHAKGQKRPGKTKWSKVRLNQDKPTMDAENPELAFEAGISFYKASKRQS